MFPTLVWKMQLAAERHQAMNARILAALDTLRRDAPPLVAGQGWQSGQALHHSEDFQDFVSCVNHATRSVLAFLRVGCDAFEITGCWANVLARGAAHRAHSHPNNFLSGAY